MTDFLLELRCEEIPARMQVKASDDLARLFAEELAKAGLKPAAIDSFVTPRRLALIRIPRHGRAISRLWSPPGCVATPCASMPCASMTCTDWYVVLLVGSSWRTP